MKVGLLTLPLLYNYGAILQAYALHKVINDMGCECVLIDKELPVYPYYRRPLSIINRLLQRFILGEKCQIYPYWMPKRVERHISKNTRKFVDDNIQPKTKLVKHLSKKHDIYDAYIVGSDQVWRRSIPLKIENYLFDFVSEEKKKIAYAASFGVDYWEFNKSKTKLFKKLLSRFSAVTVREESAISLIHQNLDLKSSQVLDPTLLLTKQDYISLLKKNNEFDGIFTYILDNSTYKQNLIHEIQQRLNLPVFDLKPKSKNDYIKNTEFYVYPEVEKWLELMAYSKFIVTDSFHGTVFSIIFNKPFIVIPNESRGNTRIESILKLCNLQSRFYKKENNIHDIINTPIDWDKVNDIISDERQRCISLLKEMIFK